MPVAKVVVKGLVRYDSLLEVHAITEEKLHYVIGITKTQQQMLAGKDSIILVKDQIIYNKTKENELTQKQVTIYKDAATVSEKKYKKEKLKGDIKEVGIGLLILGLIISLLQ